MTRNLNRPILRAIALFTLLVVLRPVFATNALADIALGDVDGQPVYLSGWMRTREYVWSYFNPGMVKNGQSEVLL